MKHLLFVLLTLNSMSYHTLDRGETFDWERTYNENHSTIGVGWEKYPWVVEISHFINSYYVPSTAVGGGYNFTPQISLRAGIMTGYSPQTFEKDGGFKYINEERSEFTGYILPTYRLQYEDLIVDLSVIPDIFIITFKVGIWNQTN